MSTAKNRAKNKPKKGGGRPPARTPEKDPESTTKKAFDLPRDSVYSADPAELRICGARGVVPDDEAGPLDTPPGPDVPVKDRIRLAKPLRTLFKASIDRRAVRVPIIIAKIDDVPTIIDGKDRARGARASNLLRAKDGRPLIKVRCVMQRDTSPLAIMATLINANNSRDDDTLADKVWKLQMFLEAGGSEADAAAEFTVGVDRIRDWLDYADRATDVLKVAVEKEEIPASTGLELAKIRDVEQQRAALAKILGGSGVRDRSARAARALAQGANGTPVATDRKSQRLLLAYLQAPDRRPSGGPSGEEFWQGVVEALKVVTGQEADPRVVQALAEARSSTPKDEPTPKGELPKATKRSAPLEAQE